MRSDGAVYDVVTRAPHTRRGLVGLTALVLAALALLAPNARAQGHGRGFLFSVPNSSFSIQAGYNAAMANSDLFSTMTSQLTLNRSDFGSPTITTSYGMSLNPTMQLVFGLGYARSVASSQYRYWLDNNNLPIQQQTEFTRIPLTVNLKAYLRPRGRSIGQYAWVPAKFAPFVGIGAGTMWYKFRQSGDWVDTVSTVVSYDLFSSSAWTPMADVFAGGDLTINPGMALTAEARYSLAKGPINGDYQGFHRIDLSGLALTAGLTFRF